MQADETMTKQESEEMIKQLEKVFDIVRLLDEETLYGGSGIESEGGVPQGVAVCVLRRGVGRQHDFCVDDSSFLGIVFLLLVVLGKQPFAALVSCGGYG